MMTSMFCYRSKPMVVIPKASSLGKTTTLVSSFGNFQTVWVLI